MASLWQDFMSSPDYLMESPLFPNPFICIRDLVSGGSREVYGRLPWGGMGLWVNQSMRWIVKSHYDDPTLYILPFIIAILLTLLRLLLNWLIFKVGTSPFSHLIIIMNPSPFSLSLLLPSSLLLPPSPSSSLPPPPPSLSSSLPPSL